MVGDNFKVLLVDDESMVRMSITNFAKKANIEMDVANNGLEAIEKVKTNSYSIVLMDILMPEMDGKTASKQIKADPSCANLKIVAMSADVLTDDDLSLNKFDSFVQKPINKNKFDEIISKFKSG